jgi:mono/diheme cytochrome c family protein
VLSFVAEDVPMKTSRVVALSAAGLALALILIQAVPYGRDHTNPSTRQEPAWADPRTRELAVRACFDCHSNETRWPWYSNVAPFSWLTQSDVDRGRRKVNYSEWNRRQKEAPKSAKRVREHDMPPWYYPWARLSRAEREELSQGLAATFGERRKGKDRDEHDD